MTREQVRREFGQPQMVRRAPVGEVWVYTNIRSAFIPFNFGYKYEGAEFVFGRDGTLSDYSTLGAP